MSYHRNDDGHSAQTQPKPFRAIPVASRADSAAARVLALVAAEEAVPPALLLHPSRCRAPIARARQMAMYLMHTLLGRTMTEVGQYFGRDRTTVSHACGRVEDWRDDALFDAAVTALEERLAGAVAASANGAEEEPSHVWH